MVDQIVKEDSEEKKDYLNKYKEAESEMERLEYKIKMIRELKMSPSVVIDGMPHGSGHSDLSDYIVKIDELEQLYVARRYQRICLFGEISEKIESLADEQEKQVLFERYIKGLKWEDVCNHIGYSWKQTHRLHNRALKNFRMA